MPSASQLSLFAAGVSPVGVGDLDGLLCGPAQLARRGRTVRLSLLVEAGWRVPALLAELGLRGVEAHVEDADPQLAERAGLVSVRTGFSDRLAPLATRWSSGSGKTVPDPMRLDGARMRLWCLAAGGPGETEHTWQLGLGPNDPLTWQPLGAALAAAGLAAALVGPRAAGPAYRLSGVRRLARLAELVGVAPQGVPSQGWPPGRWASDPATDRPHDRRATGAPANVAVGRSGP